MRCGAHRSSPTSSRIDLASIALDLFDDGAQGGLWIGRGCILRIVGLFESRIVAVGNGTGAAPLAGLARHLQPEALDAAHLEELHHLIDTTRRRTRAARRDERSDSRNRSQRSL